MKKILLSIVVMSLFQAHVVAQQPILPPCTDGVKDGCIGEEDLPSGNRYVGEYRNGKRSGFGKIIAKDNRTYEGEVENGLPNGKGVSKTSVARYEGQWKNGRYHGIGTQQYHDGSRTHVGEWENGRPNGKGVLTTKVGNKLKKYEGDFLDGNFHGEGVMNYPDDSEYKGGFKEGRRHGKGLHAFPDGSGYSGDYENDERTGRGKQYYNKIGNRFTVYEGGFLNGKFSGQGTIIYPNRSKFVGNFVEGRREGKGEFTIPDGLLTMTDTWVNDMTERERKLAEDQKTAAAARAADVELVKKTYSKMDSPCRDAIMKKYNAEPDKFGRIRGYRIGMSNIFTTPSANAYNGNPYLNYFTNFVEVRDGVNTGSFFHKNINCVYDKNSLKIMHVEISD